MNSSSLRLKNARNWFAAGLEVQKAMNVLSDGAFKIFMYICLNARRDSGILRTTQTDLARNLKKTKNTIRKLLHEMEAAGIFCQNCFSNSPVGQGTVQIAPSYWPYEGNPAESPSPSNAADAFVSDVKKSLAARACVRRSFSTADEVLARQWFSQGIPLERIKQAILLGCSRKYVSWRNNAAHGPISSLAYFDPIVQEIEDQKIDPDYWGYLQFRIQRYDRLWIESHQEKAESELGNSYPELPKAMSR
jgi:hypothetical protein